MPDRKKYIEILSKTAKTVKEFNEDTPIKISLKCIEDILELLKEQEAVTIKKTKEPYGYGVYGGICPKCRNWIQSAHSFCGFCGQAVKWE